MSEAACVRRWARWAWQLTQGQAGEAPGCELPIELARAQRLEGLLYAALRTIGHPRQSEFSITAREIVGTNLLRPMALSSTLRALSEAGVKALLYKGAATTELFPSLRGIRGVADADLLVDRSQFASARSVLLDLGFHESIESEPLSFWSNNERVFIGGQPELQIDLHRGLHRRPLFDQLAHYALRTAVKQGNGAWYPTTLAVPLLAAAHRAKHGYTADARELMDGACAFALLEDEHFAELARQANALGVSGALYAYWGLVRTWFGPTSDAESSAFIELGNELGWRRRAIDELVALDSPSDHNKPWARRGFVKLYVPYPLLGRGWIAPTALLAAHAALRTADRVVGGLDVLEPSSR